MFDLQKDLNQLKFKVIEAIKEKVENTEVREITFPSSVCISFGFDEAFINRVSFFTDLRLYGTDNLGDSIGLTGEPEVETLYVEDLLFILDAINNIK